MANGSQSRIVRALDIMTLETRLWDAACSIRDRLTWGFLKQFETPLLAISEQHEIAGILQRMDATIRVGECKRMVPEEMVRAKLGHLIERVKGVAL